MYTKEEFTEKYLTNCDCKFPYMLLSRMQSDCEYFINACHCSHKATNSLWANSPKEQIEYMKYIWESLPVKPEWLTMAQIKEYERRMVA